MDFVYRKRRNSLKIDLLICQYDGKINKILGTSTSFIAFTIYSVINHNIHIGSNTAMCKWLPQSNIFHREQQFIFNLLIL